MNIVRVNHYLDGQILITDNTPVYEVARQIAIKAHAKQTRWNGDPYITHPFRIADKFTDSRLKSIAYLHDVVEDTPITLDDLRDFGFSDEIVEAVDALTKREGELYSKFIFRTRANPLSSQVKVEDIKDNMQGVIGEPGKKNVLIKYELALFILENNEREKIASWIERNCVPFGEGPWALVREKMLEAVRSIRNGAAG